MADPSLAWHVLLGVRLAEAPDPADVAARLHDLRERLGGSADPRPPLTRADDERALWEALLQCPGDGVEAGMSGALLGLRAHHSRLDGLGLLTAAGLLAGAPVRSAARGVGQERDSAPGLRSSLLRLGEALVRPPATLPGSVPTSPSAGDSLARRTVPLAVSTPHLVVAVAEALRERVPRSARSRVRIAVGLSRRGGADADLADDSALLRMSGAVLTDASSVRNALRSAPLTPPAPTYAGSAVTEHALRLLAPRLGSSALVSHLGRIAGAGLEEVVFHPVTGGRSGLSVGAAEVGGRTVLTARARSSWNSDDDLQEFLEVVVRRLGG